MFPPNHQQTFNYVSVASSECPVTSMKPRKAWILVNYIPTQNKIRLWLVRKRGSMAAECLAVSATLLSPCPEPPLLVSPHWPCLAISCLLGRRNSNTTSQMWTPQERPGVFTGEQPPRHFCLILQPHTTLLKPLYFLILPIKKYFWTTSMCQGLS